jgi:pyruvate dehydrogenase E2 component (dihydrolipoamide acetyltransferase)
MTVDAYDIPRPPSRMRQAIARSMTASAAIPQFTIEMEASLKSAIAWQENERTSARHAASVYDVLVAGFAAGLREHRLLNSSFTRDGIVTHSDVNIGLAVALPDGLLTPAILRADELPIGRLHAERLRLTEAARSGNLTPEESLSATFTISNLGPFGVRRFQALVVPPQAAIVAVGCIDENQSVSLSLSCDHRVLDGAAAAQFLSTVRDVIQDGGWRGSGEAR